MNETALDRAIARLSSARTEEEFFSALLGPRKYQQIKLDSAKAAAKRAADLERIRRFSTTRNAAKAGGAK